MSFVPSCRDHSKTGEAGGIRQIIARRKIHIADPFSQHDCSCSARREDAEEGKVVDPHLLAICNLR